MSNEYQAFFKDLLESGPIRERENLEIKPSLPWDTTKLQVQKIILAILAFSNKSGGGKIVLGIAQDRENKNFENTGMEENDYASFSDTDRVYQSVNNYGDPAPILETVRTEYKGKKYVVIFVQEFEIGPVICKKDIVCDGEKILEKGRLYIRTPKPECKKVEDENELRKIINLAVDKEIMRFNTRRAMTGVEIQEKDEELFDKEIKDLR